MGKVKYFDTQKITTDGFDSIVDASLYTALIEPTNDYANIFQACQTSAPRRIQTGSSVSTKTTAAIHDPSAFICLLQLIFPFYSSLKARVRHFGSASPLFPGLKQTTALTP